MFEKNKNENDKFENLFFLNWKFYQERILGHNKMRKQFKNLNISH